MPFVPSFLLSDRGTARSPWSRNGARHRCLPTCRMFLPQAFNFPPVMACFCPLVSTHQSVTCISKTKDLRRVMRIGWAVRLTITIHFTKACPYQTQMHVYYELSTVLGTYLLTLPPTRAEVRLRTLIQSLLSREASVETSAFRRERF